MNQLEADMVDAVLGADTMRRIDREEEATTSSRFDANGIGVPFKSCNGGQAQLQGTPYDRVPQVSATVIA